MAPSLLPDVGGRALRGLFAVLRAVRSPRPIHPHGLVLGGEVRWLRVASAPTGIRWIDQPPEGGVQGVTARLSRSIGLPAVLPDVIGLALRFDTPEGPADLELATTGIGVPSRFGLLPRRLPSRGTLGTLIPYRGSLGPILLCARTRFPERLPAGLTDAAAALEATPWLLDLYWATPTSRWRRFAEVELRKHPGPMDTAGLRFDAARHPLPGAGMYDWIARLRNPSYRRTQHPEPQHLDAAR